MRPLESQTSFSYEVFFIAECRYAIGVTAHTKKSVIFFLLKTQLYSLEDLSIKIVIVVFDFGGHCLPKHQHLWISFNLLRS